MPHSLTHPERLTITGPQGETYQGGDQEWYRDLWQRRAGCGPTTAAALLSYLSQTRPGSAPWYRRRPGPRRAFSATWRPSGPTSPPVPGGWISRRAWCWAAAPSPCPGDAVSRGRCWRSPPSGRPGPPWTSAGQFVAQCLDQDCPVAFLNFSHGALKNLDSWHWVPLTAMTEGESVLLCTILDEGKRG